MKLKERKFHQILLRRRGVKCCNCGTRSGPLFRSVGPSGTANQLIMSRACRRSRLDRIEASEGSNVHWPIELITTSGRPRSSLGHSLDSDGHVIQLICPRSRCQDSIQRGTTDVFAERRFRLPAVARRHADGGQTSGRSPI
jgi:hypothetical protein